MRWIRSQWLHRSGWPQLRQILIKAVVVDQSDSANGSMLPQHDAPHRRLVSVGWSGDSQLVQGAAGEPGVRAPMARRRQTNPLGFWRRPNPGVSRLSFWVHGPAIDMPATVCALGPPIRITPSPLLGSRVSDVHENPAVHVYVNSRQKRERIASGRRKKNTPVLLTKRRPPVLAKSPSCHF